MDCDRVRDLLARVETTAPLAPESERHLAACPECARFAARLAAARLALRSRLDVRPDPTFARRVVARLPRSAEVLGWVAVRLLPAATVLALILGGIGLAQTPPASSLLGDDDPSPEAILTYAALHPGEGR
ncbi:MAG TPA: hypothetical protein VOA87_06390 [Thermoanaerobaculia bacterium]|nr:hypothetical protein [Thermoanaerobaculia bacterium]